MSGGAIAAILGSCFLMFFGMLVLLSLGSPMRRRPTPARSSQSRSGYWSGTTSRTSRRPPRRITTSAGWPTGSSISRLCKASIPVTGSSPSATRRSSSSRPAASAGPPVATEMTSTAVGWSRPNSGQVAGQGDVAAVEAEVAADDLAVLQELRQDVPGHVHRDREADPLRGAITAVLMPMTWPRPSTSGPPELPGLARRRSGSRCRRGAR